MLDNSLHMLTKMRAEELAKAPKMANINMEKKNKYEKTT